MIFLGAGASAPFKIPTSPKLTEFLTRKIEADYPNLLADIQTFLSVNERSLDFENILKILYVLTNETSVRNEDFTRSFLTGYGHRGDYSKIIDSMYNHICLECTSPFRKKSKNYLDTFELEQIYSTTFDPIIGVLLKSGNGEVVFSTNYDPTVEFWCEKRNITCNDGRNRTENPEFYHLQSHENFIQQLRSKRIGDKGIDLVDQIPLIRLHGSVLSRNTKSGRIIKFGRIMENLVYPDLYADFLEKNPQLIFPGYEDEVRRGNSRALYRYFEDQLRGKCLFIGYSFRHAAINGPIIDNLLNGNITELGIFSPNPDTNLNNLYRVSRASEIDENRIIKIKGKFGTQKGLDEFYKKWWSGNYSSQDVYNNDVMNWVKERSTIYN